MMANEVYVGGFKLDIISGDVSHFDMAVRKHLDGGGGWLAYDQGSHHYQLHITDSTDIVIRYDN